MFRKDKSKDIEENIKKSFEAVKDELNEHLEAINENTNEIQANHGYIVELEEKLIKLSEKIDELQLSINQVRIDGKKRIKLTFAEKRVFFVLYSFEISALSYADIANKTGFSELVVKKNLHSLISKGIPIIEQTIEHKKYFKLESDFKDLQTRQNIIDITLEN